MRRDRVGRLLGAGRRRRIAAALALLAAVVVVVAIVLGTRSSNSPGASGADTQASGATTVQRRNLVATDTESGTLSYAAPRTVYNRLSGTITWLPSVGQVIQPGQALFKVDQQPAILMNGSTPAYRNLNASDSDGPDILELNRNLVDLGFNPDGIVVDDVWQPATTDAVEVYQESLGESPTGSLSLGQVVFLPGAQVVSTVEGTLGSAASDHTDGPAPEFVSLTTTTPRTGTSTTGTPATTPTRKPARHHRGHSTSGGGQSATTLAALVALLRAEIAELKAASHSASPSSSNSPSRNSSNSGSHNSSNSGNHNSSNSGNHNASDSGSPSSPNSGSPSGGGGGGATPVLQTSSTELVATVDLDASKQSEAKVGEKVTVEMPAGNTVNGTITAVSPVAQNSSNSGNGNNAGGNNSGGNGNNGNGSSGATIPVTIALSGHQTGAGLDQASVSVNFVQSEANNVLSVPVTALLATSGGGYAVQEAGAPHSLVPVTTGLFAAGYVQISGPGIYPGLQVTDSQG